MSDAAIVTIVDMLQSTVKSDMPKEDVEKIVTAAADLLYSYVNQETQ